MSEGNVWPCKWSRTNDGYEITVRPIWRTLRVEAHTIDAAVMAMKDKICDGYGDGEAYLLPDEPFPVVLATKLASVGTHVQLSSNGGTSSVLTPPEELWEGGVCPGCGAARNKRNNKQALVYIDSEGDVPICRTEHGPIQLISERLARQFTPKERERFVFRPIDTYESTPLKYVEVTPIKPDSAVWPVDVPPHGFRCPMCPSTRISVAHDVQQDVWLFVRAESVPDGSIRSVSDWTRFDFVCSLARWRELRAQGVLERTAYRLVGLLEGQNAVAPAGFEKEVVPYIYTNERIRENQARLIQFIESRRSMRGKVFERDGHLMCIGEPTRSVPERAFLALKRWWRG